MEEIVLKIKAAIESAVAVIQSQKSTILELKAKLSSISEEYAQFVEEEVQEDAATDAMLETLSKVADDLQSVIDAGISSETEPE